MVERAAPVADRAVVDHGDAGRRDALADPARKGRGALAVEIALEAVADRLVQQHARPAGAEHHRHLARRRGDRFEVHQRLRQRDVDRPVPALRLEQVVVEVAAAEAVEAGLAPPVLLGHDLDVEPHQRPHVVRDEAVRADDVDHAPRARQADRDLGDARIAGARRRVDLLAERDLPREGDQAQRIAVRVELRVGPPRRRGAGALRRIEHRHRLGGAADRAFAELVGLGEGRGLARNPAQAEARLGVEIGGLQPPVVEAEALRGDILEIKLAIVAALQRIGGELERGVGIEAAGAVEEAAGIAGHAADIVALRVSRQPRAR